MRLWRVWWKTMRLLQPAFKDKRTFIWFLTACAGITIRKDMAGVTSIIRAIGLKAHCYDRLLGMFHSKAVSVPKLTSIWKNSVLTLFRPFLYKLNGRIVLIADEIKIAKAGKKMPAVKKLYQSSESNTKPAYIFGHSCQAIAVLAGSINSFFAIPLSCRIHEGLVFSNRSKKTLVDKLALLIQELAFEMPVYLAADAYYAARNMILPLIKEGHHLISVVRSNAVAYYPAEQPQNSRRGAPRKYGPKIKLRTLFNDLDNMASMESPVYGERKTHLKYRTIDLLWRRIGIMVRFVAVIHPIRGKKIFMTTDLSLSAVDLIRIYGYRFKIEIAFKQAIHTIGVYAYHFWMKNMKPIKRKTGNQYLHRDSEKYRQNVIRKMGAYHVHMMAGIVTQGMLQYLSIAHTNLVWNSFGSWIRTIRPHVLPSEKVVAVALRNVFPEFLAGSSNNNNLVEFIRNNIDIERSEGMKMVA